MRSIRYLALTFCLSAAACSGSPTKHPTTSNETLTLTRVFLYRNGIGYFERDGHVDGDILRIKVRKDQVNDLLKSLTVVNRKGGQAVSISMPLDPQTWANAALATLAPGRGNLAEVLDALRGTAVILVSADRTVQGRIVMVEEIQNEPDPAGAIRKGQPATPVRDHRITLLDGSKMNVMRLSAVRDVTLEDGDVAMQIHRSLDASAGEGMFQQVDVSIRLTGANSHDLVVSYVAPAPMWKPTYRVVLPPSGKGKALLQGWAVVDNTSGEEWRDVKLGLTAGAPIAFRYDLHTPRDVERSDLTETGVTKRAAVAVGETTYAEEAEPPPPPAAAPAPMAAPAEMDEYAERSVKDDKAATKEKKAGYGSGAASGKVAAKRSAMSSSAPTKAPASAPKPSRAKVAAEAAAPPAVDAEGLRRSTLAQARASAVSGLTRFDIDQRVTVPDGASTMVAVINQDVEGEETFMFRPGGGGMGYESNPYRVVRFKNSTPFVLESGPIAIYAGGSFVGEGISEAVGSGTSATIPFAVEPGIMVTSSVKQDSDEVRLLKIVRGVLEVESFARKTTTYTVKSQVSRPPFAVIVRHSKAGQNYELLNRTKTTEDLADAYLIPVDVAKDKREGSTTVVEQTPSRYGISIWEGRALTLLEKLLLVTNLGPDARKRLEPIVRDRQEMGRIDSKIEELKSQQSELDQRARETRENLKAIQKDKAAGALRSKLSKRLEQFASEGDKLGREVVELQTKRMELRIKVEDAMQDLDLTAPEPIKK
jgi:hypothetical protein